MPRKTHANHPDHTRTAASKPVPAAYSNDVPQAHHSPIQNPLDGTDHHGMILLHTLLCRTDGWLRVVPDGDGKLVWWKWKFTAGKHAGCYAMVRGEQDQHTESLRVLARKLRAIDEGSSRPTRDSYYDQG